VTILDKKDIIKDIIGYNGQPEQVACFDKVSLVQFLIDIRDNPLFKDIENKQDIYNSILLPKRGTANSAGYDIFSLVDFELKPGETIVVPTGIRCAMKKDWVLLILPRSGSGFKYRVQLYNTAGVIDADYYGAKNEGHIFVKIINDNYENKVWTVKKGEAICQGIFLPYGITFNDEAKSTRVGGFGSTTNT
jgi:dUTP pyrophosphatase